ncbi:MAG: hypothetical protein P8188_12420 [Gemmatimonadota bacterium]
MDTPLTALTNTAEIETRTSKLVEQLVEAVQKDMDDAVVDLEKGLKLLEALVGDTKGVNGLSSFLKAQSQQLAKMIDDIRDESDAVARKLFGTGRPEIVERVNQEKLEELREAV